MAYLRTRKLREIGTRFYKISVVSLKGKQHDYFKMKDVVTSWSEWMRECVLGVQWRPPTGTVSGVIGILVLHTFTLHSIVKAEDN